MSKTNIPPSDLKLLETKEFWEKVVEELLQLQEILAGKGTKVDDREDYY